MNILVTFWSHHPHRGRGLAAAVLTLALLLPACTAPTHPTNQPADPPLANLQTSKLANLHQAAYNYARYHALAPDDLLGLKRLTEVCTALEQAGVDDESCREAAALREALEAKTDDRRIVAELLGVPVEDVELGPNLVKNGGFEEWVAGRPKWWKWSAMFSREPFGDAAFVGGAEELLPFKGQQTARVDGFWMQRQEDESKARAGFWHCNEGKEDLRDIPLTANVPYVLSFWYRTVRVSNGSATVWVSRADEPDVFWSGGNHGLPTTGRGWHRFTAIGWNRSDAEVAIRPLFRLYARGCVEFDDVQVRLIGLPEGTVVKTSETQFWTTGEDD